MTKKRLNDRKIFLMLNKRNKASGREEYYKLQKLWNNLEGKEWKQKWINECNIKRRKMRERKVWVEYRKSKSRNDRKLVTVNAIEALKKK